MHYKTALALFLGVAAAAPKAQLNAPQVSEGPSSIKINGVSLLGTGCPAGTADVQVDATGELFEATFSAYEVLTGPGTRASDWRKNCKLTLNLEFDRGFQYVLARFIVETRCSLFLLVLPSNTGTDSLSWLPT